MTPQLIISRRTLALVLLGLACGVIGATLLDQRGGRPASHKAALRLLQRRVLEVVERALKPIEWSDEDREILARSIAPDAGIALHEQAVRLYTSHGRISEGILSYRQLLAAKPEDPRALLGLGSLLLHRGRIPEAKRLLEGALSRAPGLWQASLKLAACLGCEGKLDEALAICRRVLGGRGQPEAHRLRSAYALKTQFLLRMGRAREALESSNRAVGLARTSLPGGQDALGLAQSLTLRASVYVALQSPTEALADFEEARSVAESLQARALLVAIAYGQAAAAEEAGQTRLAAAHERSAGSLIEWFTDEALLREALTLPGRVSRSGPS
jgi:tetratricopeptide (TPR) repeat protein